MKDGFWFVFALVVLVAALAGLSPAAPQPALPATTPGPTPAGHVASPDELARARAEWQRSAHASTYDGGMGANTTCARCKSPANWDPAALAADAAHDCAACKRVPGAPRPALEGGVPVPESEWRHIDCAVCHPPAPSGDSFYTGIAFWDPSTGAYQPVSSPAELCGRCHEGRHGFEVMTEQAASPAHQGWSCTKCHGAHGGKIACRDCHDPAQGAATADHARHANVNCTACHDAGGLTIWLDTDPASRHQGEYVTRRFAHTITSWPSHDLRREVDCRRCHHPRAQDAAGMIPIQRAPVAAEVGCTACHAGGAVLAWCVNFPRNPDANATPAGPGQPGGELP